VHHAPKNENVVRFGTHPPKLLEGHQPDVMTCDDVIDIPFPPFATPRPPSYRVQIALSERNSTTTPFDSEAGHYIHSRHGNVSARSLRQARAQVQTST
jgi:hypothetical protein